jgi:hypothetical protein
LLASQDYNNRATRSNSLRQNLEDSARRKEWIVGLSYNGFSRRTFNWGVGALMGGIGTRNPYVTLHLELILKFF